MGKTFKISVNERVYDVDVGDLSESPVKVRIDGELFLVRVEEAAATAAVLLSEPASASPPPPAPVVAQAAERPVPSRQPTVEQQNKGAKAPPAVDSRMVTAPMPGVVLAVKVKVGDRVRNGEEMCTLESMKMELNIMAARDGVVSKVCVAVGQAVVHGTVLVELE